MDNSIKDDIELMKGGTVIYVNYNDLVDRYMKYQEQQLKRTLD